MLKLKIKIKMKTKIIILGEENAPMCGANATNVAIETVDVWQPDFTVFETGQLVEGPVDEIEKCIEHLERGDVMYLDDKYITENYIHENGCYFLKK